MIYLLITVLILLIKQFCQEFKNGMVGKWSSQIPESVDCHDINTCIYTPLAECSYMQLPEKLRNSRKLENICLSEDVLKTS